MRHKTWEPACPKQQLKASEHIRHLNRTWGYGAVCSVPQSCPTPWVFAIPWTVAHQAPLSLGFSSKNTGVGCCALLQEIFPTQQSKPGLPHCWQILYHLRQLYLKPKSKQLALKSKDSLGYKQCHHPWPGISTWSPLCMGNRGSWCPSML